MNTTLMKEKQAPQKQKQDNPTTSPTPDLKLKCSQITQMAVIGVKKVLLVEIVHKAKREDPKK